MSKKETKRSPKTLSTVANINSGLGYTAGLFGGIAVGVNVAKAMDGEGVNSGIAIATGAVAGIGVLAVAGICTELISGTIRRKAGIVSPMDMLRYGNAGYFAVQQPPTESEVTT